MNSFELDNYLTLMKEGLEADYWVAALLHYYNKFKTNQLLDFVKDVISSAELKGNTVDLKRILTGGIYGRRYARYLLLKLDLLYLGQTNLVILFN